MTPDEQHGVWYVTIPAREQYLADFQFYGGAIFSCLLFIWNQLFELKQTESVTLFWSLNYNQPRVSTVKCELGGGGKDQEIWILTSHVFLDKSVPTMGLSFIISKIGGRANWLEIL